MTTKLGSARTFCVLDRDMAISAGFKPLSDFGKFAIVSERNGRYDACHGWTLKEESAHEQAQKRNSANKAIQAMFAKTMIMVDREEAKENANKDAV